MLPQLRSRHRLRRRRCLRQVSWAAFFVMLAWRLARGCVCERCVRCVCVCACDGHGGRARIRQSAQRKLLTDRHPSCLPHHRIAAAHLHFFSLFSLSLFSQRSEPDHQRHTHPGRPKRGHVCVATGVNDAVPVSPSSRIPLSIPVSLARGRPLGGRLHATRCLKAREPFSSSRVAATPFLYIYYPKPPCKGFSTLPQMA